MIEGGKEYHPDENGLVLVENPDHVEILKHHDYTIYTGPSAPQTAAVASSGDDDDEGDQFDDMTKGELIEWLEERDVEIPNRPKVDQLRELARKHSEESED